MTTPHSANSFTCHPSADVKSDRIGRGTTIWQYAVVAAGARIGEDCNINCHTFVEGEAQIGSRVTLKVGVSIWSGVTLEDDVFVGPNATFTNDLRPRSKRPRPLVPTLVKQGASIGAAATVVCGITIGRYAMVGAGALVTRDVPDHALVVGAPARIVGWVDEAGERLVEQAPGVFVSANGGRYSVGARGLLPSPQAIGDDPPV
jgi:acetyltransferase-like isoleucine patch superfamily enzyme